MKYSAGYKYILREDLVYQCRFVRPAQTVETAFIRLDVNGLLTIKRYYAWDGPSGPTIDTKSSMRGSLVHDALFQLMRLGLLDRANFHAANQELHSILIADGMFKWRAWLWVQGVEKFSRPFCQAAAEPEVLTAP